MHSVGLDRYFKRRNWQNIWQSVLLWSSRYVILYWNTNKVKHNTSVLCTNLLHVSLIRHFYYFGIILTKQKLELKTISKYKIKQNIEDCFWVNIFFGLILGQHILWIDFGSTYSLDWFWVNIFFGLILVQHILWIEIKQEFILNTTKI